jgi:predicted MPP superfamily phosphohydrolase
LLSALLIDLLRLTNAIVPWFPAFVTADPLRTTKMVFWGVTTVVGLLILAGHINARIPRIHRISIPVEKSADGVRSIRIVLVSDIHLGTIVGRSRLESIVEKIHGLEPDLILLAGDIVDEDLAPVIKENTGEILRTIHAPMGVYGITGNHEYIGGAEKAVAYLEEHGITMLRDTFAVLPHGITLVGREDRSSRQFGGKRRKDLGVLLEGVRHDRPILMMDHQPFDLDSVVAAGVDLQVSGHTHHGQLWPFNYITTMVYELSWGYLKKGTTNFYVSSGVGSWGPPVRLGNRPEIVEITLTFSTP